MGNSRDFMYSDSPFARKYNGRTVNVLGATYTIHVVSREDPIWSTECLCDANGFTEPWSRKIVIKDDSTLEGADVMELLENRQLKTIRHELFHAMFKEIGLLKYTDDENLIEVLANTLPQIYEVMRVHDLAEWEP